MNSRRKAERTRKTTDVVPSRVLAQLIDFIAYIVVIVAVMYVYLKAVGPGATRESAAILGFLSVLAYNTLLEAYWNGQTVGKQVFGIRVVNSHRSDPSLGQALVRNIPSAVPVGGALAVIVALVAIASTDSHQRVFDMIAGTFVVADSG